MGSWKILRKLSEGPSAEVYEAVTPEGGQVAVKRLLSLDDEGRALFEGQARLLVRLRHPAVVPVLGFLLHSEALFGEDRGPCFWMEMVSGRPLLEAARTAETGTILGWFREAVDALSFFHGQEVLHGDLSPHNLRIDDQGKLKILDFSVLPGDAASSDVATLPYMAPERIDGRLVPAGDIFSLGTIFYEALAGRHPRAGCRTVQDLIAASPPSLGDVAPRMAGHPLEARVIDRMIRADLKERLAGPSAVGKALQGAAVEEVPEGVPVFSPLTMIGADGAFAAVSQCLDRAAEKKVLVAVHGPSGSGTTRFRREIVFEAALRGIACREFPDIDRLDGAGLARVLAGLRALPPRGFLAIADWSDDRLTEDGRRFCSALLTEEGLIEAALRPLDRDELKKLLRGFLTEEAADESADFLSGRTQGNPGRVLEILRNLASAHLLRDRSLLPGWKDFLQKEDVPEAEPRDPTELSRFLRREINRLNGLGRYVQALEIAERWFSLKAEDEPLLLRTVKYWFITGWGLHNLGRFDEAEERLKRCVHEAAARVSEPEIASMAARARSLLGLAALRRGDAKAAEAEFRATLGLQPETGFATAETFRNLARALEASGDEAGASASLDRAKS
ncbi:MAG TPA: serine/threonine-protein kinase, partial [bacterium]|nr:serine/threonine-protein kinase [bacterium]